MNTETQKSNGNKSPLTVTGTNSGQINVPFLDLKAQYATIKGQMRGAIDGVLDSAEFIGGHWLTEFEDKFSRFVDAKFTVGVSSGTSALSIALRAMGIVPGDEVIVPTNSFFATAEAVSNIGAVPVFADADPSTFHLDLVSAEKAITRKTRAIIPVHLYGRAMNLKAVEGFAKRHDLIIIEDACQAHGSSIAGRRIGSGPWVACFSFYPGKNLGAYGDAGAITCSDADLAQKMRVLREHGSPSKYEHTVVGANDRLDSLQAAILSAKLDHLEDWNRRRVKHARAYAQALAGSSIIPPQIPPDGEHNFHLFVVRSSKRDELRHYLQQRGIGTGIHYPTPIHLTAAYQELGAPKAGSFPVSEKLAGEILSLPMYAEMTESQVSHTIQVLLDFAKANGESQEVPLTEEKSHHV